MKYRTLGDAGLRVSEISMGTFTFGGRGDFAMVGEQGVPEARRLVDCCLDHGVNLFDCANMYSTGLAEEILGEVLDGRPEPLVTSKVRMPIGDGPNDAGASRYHILRECERSLKKLRRDRIDIYYLHEWDGSVPLEETLSALETLIRDGKVRHVGCSNYSGWHMMKALGIADRTGLPRFATQQIHYTLEAREVEYELLPAAVDQGLGTLVWSPLAAGLLSGKHRRGQYPADGSRQSRGWSEPPIRDWERLWNIVDVLVDLAEARGATPAQMALAWLLDRPSVASLVVGGSDTAQFEENIASADISLTDAERARLDEVSTIPLLYPYWHQDQFARDTFTSADRALLPERFRG
ncbi:Predicted oxidoreductase [Tranquillimonas rosea]|uniref:Predicted oxidoreductase n=1 Tax=Tranquillimonas rosea TaxID=641238 RepID=A0A1H9VDI9_9RHOB|nr:aldo/keto reductase [Tranquillimonas rosea]SES19722.1 Predicted oxidoreductase [Tranquillimonas rosea]